MENIEIIIREIEKTDYQELFQCASDELGAKVNVKQLFSTVRKTKKNSDCKTFIVILDSKIVAFITVWKNNDNCLKIKNFLIHKKYENKSIGSMLIDYVENYASKNSLNFNENQRLKEITREL